jgi:hypothetical protein
MNEVILTEIMSRHSVHNYMAKCKNTGEIAYGQTSEEALGILKNGWEKTGLGQDFILVSEPCSAQDAYRNMHRWD